MKAAAIFSLLAVAANAFVLPTPKAPQTVVKGTPFDTVDKAEMAVENKALSGMSVFERAMADFNGRYPAVAALGLGPSVKAERWNGRHAMFGWIALLATGYAQAHGLLPEGGMDAKEWGTWVIVNTDPATGAVTTIPAARAAIAIAHLHLGAVGVFAAYSKNSVKDRLLLEPGEKDEAPAGLFPALRPGLTKDAEILNGRIAMLGLIALVAVAAATGQDILSTIDQGLGGLLLKA
ncbi:hypothetical protein NSK_004148 [Nannochloropsis salina CCMP1776]|uniref:Uncharacterized protein n=1 Tax=Nannochloropsis salina CCMP1776 TaxID=1027361 RepID=A0A4D9D169_9STRA|nr:hypothetical protein NSK_004148 [Nannochloropsis salina CCMP1776]|eukprot:TFJ84684.1 hypothetical protein NSK_004148 [Nannochloropsis salina CCMP1776]